ncbi:MAG: MarR family transcriptional regulator [Lentisphaeria bacterium]|nr:MarR family transcriptional regulator [Lentisphaeria bacterium]
MSRGKKICQLLFGTADEFRECAANYNELPPAEVAKVTLGQLRVLKAVHLLSSQGDEGGIMLKTLAAKIDLTPGAASIIVDSLVKMKLLDRLPDENDRRAVKIRLSQLGEEQFRRHFDYFFNTMDEILSAVPEEELAVFEKVFTFLSDGVHAIREQGSSASRQVKK